MSVPVADMVSIGAVMAGTDLTPPRDTLIFTPPPGAVATLQRLHAAAAHLAETAPEIIANPNAAYGLEQALIEAMVGCLCNNEAREDSVAQRQHELIMRRFRRVVEESPDRPLYIPELCKAIGVSERTLRVCCQEQLGLGSKRYLLFRRLHLARRALRAGSSDATSVTKIATRYGFWHFGRFAGEYQSLFGEPPPRHFFARPSSAASICRKWIDRRFSRLPQSSALRLVPLGSRSRRGRSSNAGCDQIMPRDKASCLPGPDHERSQAGHRGEEPILGADVRRCVSSRPGRGGLA
jgi:AraC-like DNA-binding protein